jgi:all-trans-8'-apo-beta-carotenal 15,15'-oxygenase
MTMKAVLATLLLLLIAESAYVNAFVPLVQSPARRVVLNVSPSIEEGPAETATTVAPDMKAYSSGYSTVFGELPCKECAPSEGSIPKDLIGSYFRCGPAMFSAGSIVPPKASIVQPKSPPVPDGQDPDRMVKHPFEGDGAVLGVTFSGNETAVARFRYVRTNAFTNERRKGRRLYTAMDSTRAMGPTAGAGVGNDMPLPLYRHHLQPGLNKQRKNTSNTRAIYWAKRLLTLWEGGLPYKLDALALSTEGRSQLGGVLKEAEPLGGKSVFDSKKDRMLFYGNKQDAKTSQLTVYEFNSKFRLVPEEGGKVVTELPGFALLSSFCATENYSIFVQPPVAANGVQFMLSKEPGKTLSVEENGASLLHLIPRVGSGKRQKTLAIPFDGVIDADLEFINAFEEDGKVIFDAIRSDGRNAKQSKPISYPWASSLDEFAQSTSKKSLVRYTVNVGSGSVSKEVISDLQCFFGNVNPAVSAQKHRYVYSAVGGLGVEVAPPQGIAKFDCDTRETQVWMPKEYEFCGEPMFATRENASSEEDDGYILSVLYNGQSKESEMVILRADAIADGPIARLPLGMRVPHGLYGCFTNAADTNWSAEEIERRAKLADKMESRGNNWNEVKSDFSGLGLRLDDIEEYFGDIM